METRNIRDYVLALDPVPVLAECFHSYSQLWLWPYGYAYNAYPENYQAQCLKISQKSRIQHCELRSYVYILSGQKLIKNAKIVNFGELLKT